MIRKVTFELGRAVRETGQALDRLGLRVLGQTPERCTLCRIRIAYDGRGSTHTRHADLIPFQSRATARS
jgi:hypothetical protein